MWVTEALVDDTWSVLNMFSASSVLHRSSKTTYATALVVTVFPHGLEGIHQLRGLAFSCFFSSPSVFQLSSAKYSTRCIGALRS